MPHVPSVVRTCAIAIILAGCGSSDEEQTRIRMQNITSANETVLGLLLFYEAQNHFPENLGRLVEVVESQQDKQRVFRNLRFTDPDTHKKLPWSYRIDDPQTPGSKPTATIEARRADGTTILRRSTSRGKNR